MFVHVIKTGSCGDGTHSSRKYSVSTSEVIGYISIGAYIHKASVSASVKPYNDISSKKKSEIRWFTKDLVPTLQVRIKTSTACRKKLYIPTSTMV